MNRAAAVLLVALLLLAGSACDRGRESSLPSEAGAGAAELAELPEQLPELRELDATDAEVTDDDGTRTITVTYNTTNPAIEVIAVYSRRLRDQGWNVQENPRASTHEFTGFGSTGTLRADGDNTLILTIDAPAASSRDS